MKQKMLDGKVELVFEPPFPAPELMSKLLVVIALPDGKRYVADIEQGGNMLYVARVDRDGTPDEGFGVGGWRVESVDISGALPVGMLLREGGGVVVAANNREQCGLVCFKADGTLDSAFGQNGKIVHSVEAHAHQTLSPPSGTDMDGPGLENISSTPYGSIAPGRGGLFYSLMGTRSSRGNSTVIRCQYDGQLDPEFNGNGIVPVIHPTQSNGGVAIAPTSDGGVVITGTLGSLQGDLRPFFCRYNADGSLDNNFGENGFAVFDSESAGVPPSSLYQIELNHITPRANGDFVAAGYLVTKTPYNYYGLLISVDSRGRLSASFNNARPVLFGLMDGAQELMFLNGGINEQFDGKLIVGGGVVERDPEFTSDMLVIRFHPNGSLDSSFGDQGLLRFKPHDYLVNYIWHLQSDQDGKVLLAGCGGVNNALGTHREVVVQIA